VSLDSNLDKYVFYLDTILNGETNQFIVSSGNSYTATSSLNDGLWYAKVRAYDKSGNYSESGESSVLIDTISPSSFQVIYPTNKAILNKNLFSLDWEDSQDSGSGLLGYEVFMDEQKISGSLALAQSKFQLVNSLSEGLHSFYINALDNSGNVRVSESFSFTIDLTSPTSVITSPTNSGSNSTIYLNSWDGKILGNIADNAEGSGIMGLDLSIMKNSNGKYWNGATWVTAGSEVSNAINANANGDWEYVLPNPDFDEKYIIKSHAKDLAGNIESTYTLNLVYDKNSPVLSYKLDPEKPSGENNWYVGKPKISFSATDFALSKIEYQLNSKDGAWLLYTLPITLEEGTTNFYYRALDLAGNISTAQVVEVKVDLTRPEDVGNLEAQAEDEEVSLNWDKSPSSDVSLYQIYKSTNKNFIPNPETLIKELEESKKSYTDSKVDNDVKYYYYVVAVDTAGLKSNAKGVSAKPSKELPETSPTSSLNIPSGVVQGASTRDKNEVEEKPLENNFIKEDKGEVMGAENSNTSSALGSSQNNIKSPLAIFLDKFWFLIFPIAISFVVSIYFYLKSK